MAGHHVRGDLSSSPGAVINPEGRRAVTGSRVVAGDSVEYPMPYNDEILNT
jgi:hypothetical protein